VNEQLKREALAVMDGMILDGPHIERLPDGDLWNKTAMSRILIPDYNDLNNLHRLICGLSDFSKYWRILHEVTKPKGMHAQYNPTELCAKAELAQIQEALLKAEGLWVDDEH